jgi:large subunit ribosomal protein L25
MSQVAIEIRERFSSEKGKNLRKSGEIPGIIYGEFLDKPISVKVNNSTLKKLLSTNSKGSIIKLKLEDNIKNCVIKHVEKNYLTGEIIHVDFQYVRKNEVIKMKMPLNFTGFENLKVKLLAFETVVSEIELKGNVDKIPENIIIDVSHLNFGDRLFVSDIKLPEEVSLITDPEILLGVVKGAK